LGDDLVVEGVEVHAKAREVLGFWFGALMPEQRFGKSDSVDSGIREQFGSLRNMVLASGALGWRDEPETLLAAVILLDQFSRNMYRGQPEAFAADALAQELTCEALDRDWDAGMTPDERQFLYMPLMHAEDPELQGLCLKMFDQLGVEQNIRYAREHAEVIERFGRFPTRNAALGRESTREEEAYLRQPNVGW
jgi:uncharacterized protein (DUF924 family)